MNGIRIAKVGLVAGGLMAIPHAALAQAEGELVKNFLGSLGVIDVDKPPIDYRERAPLVLPPRMDLPEPAAPGSVQARNPQWPHDPDVVARKREAAEASLPVTQTDKYRMNSENTRLNVHEARADRRAGAELPTGPVTRPRDNAWIHPDVLRAQELERRGRPADGRDEAARRSLTEPPSAYRQSATGQPIRGSWEAPNREDVADPKVFQRQQQQRY